MQHSDQGNALINKQQELYYRFAHAAETYVKKPTISNWAKKEKAFESYNAIIQRKISEQVEKQR